jgi:hypothetical protein
MLHAFAATVPGSATAAKGGQTPTEHAFDGNCATRVAIAHGKGAALVANYSAF